MGWLQEIVGGWAGGGAATETGSHSSFPGLLGRAVVLAPVPSFSLMDVGEHCQVVPTHRWGRCLPRGPFPGELCLRLA